MRAKGFGSGGGSTAVLFLAEPTAGAFVTAASDHHYAAAANGAATTPGANATTGSLSLPAAPEELFGRVSVPHLGSRPQ